MESQASLMVKCMLLALQKYQQNSNLTINNGYYTNFTNIASASNFTIFENQSLENDSLETNPYNFQAYNRHLQQ